MKLGDRLRLLRKKKGLTQTEFAERMGMPNQNVSNYERDFRQPDYETLKKFADYFEVSTDYLLGITENPEGAKIKDSPSSRDEKDIAKRLEEFKKDLTSSDGLNFSGEPMSEDAKESLIEAMDHIFRQTQRINKKFIPKKHRQDED